MHSLGSQKPFSDTSRSAGGYAGTCSSAANIDSLAQKIFQVRFSACKTIHHSEMKGTSLALHTLYSDPGILVHLLHASVRRYLVSEDHFAIKLAYFKSFQYVWVITTTLKKRCVPSDDVQLRSVAKQEKRNGEMIEGMCLVALRMVFIPACGRTLAPEAQT